MANSIKRYIISGAPGTGKSSVLNALEVKGYYCFEEVSRVIIREQQECNGDLFPWGNLDLFAKECYKRMHSDCKNAKPGINFFDRAIPDIIAYLKRRELNVDNTYFKSLDCYEKDVFFFPVWETIFINDPQRPESIEEAYLLEKHLLGTYQDLGFTIHKMPLVDIGKRVNEIQRIIKNGFQ